MGLFDKLLGRTVEVSCPFCDPLMLALNIIVILALVYVVARFFTKHKLILAIVAGAAAYFLFFA